jgi:hypothetical protein
LLLGALVLGERSAVASEMQDRAIIAGAARQAFLRGDFAQLESVSHSFRTTKSRTSSGLWKLTLFYAGIATGIDAQAGAQPRDAAFRELEDRTTRWAEQYPGSPSAHISKSMVHIAHAWAHRGGGFAPTVRPEAWAPFHKYISLARQNLEAHKSVAAADPRWYETMLTVARAEGWERHEFDSLLNEALEREPVFYQTYFLALEYLLPKWHGGTREIEAFAQEAVRRTSEQEGRGMYARIYWFASQTQFQNDLFNESFVAWSRMKEGFEDVIARYPDAWNLNNYAKFACLARDRKKARELMKRIESTVVVEAWQPQSLQQRCSDWAFRE